MRKKNKIIVMVASLVILVCGVWLFLMLDFDSEVDADGRLAVYFYNPATKRLEAELREIPDGDIYARVNSALWDFVRGPRGETLAGVWPAGMEFEDFVTDIYIENEILVAWFSEIYTEMPTVDEVIFRAAFTLTMTGLDYIEGVAFRTEYTDGSIHERLETPGTIANAPFISPARRTAEDFTLFFACESGEGLFTAIYEAEEVNVHTRNQYILERLIYGQNDEGILPIIPPETRVLEVLVELDAGIYVDLSGEFVRGFTGSPTQARLMLQSITHTMLENNPGPPRRVFFLIDSDRHDEFHGVSDFNLGFTTDETVMRGFVAEYEQE